jgi:hypothetical protein
MHLTKNKYKRIKLNIVRSWTWPTLPPEWSTRGAKLLRGRLDVAATRRDEKIVGRHHVHPSKKASSEATRRCSGHSTKAWWMPSSLVLMSGRSGRLRRRRRLCGEEKRWSVTFATRGNQTRPRPTTATKAASLLRAALSLGLPQHSGDNELTRRWMTRTQDSIALCAR